jgi:biphenyl-2,3-diol 1,2-dioxygenase/3,4-dihydroxy-9,10-secoandrosta-1,3,5(10)-triene-9,17-dione 4,5-dioxygenase
VSGGVTQLSALSFEVSDLAAWELFATEVLGLGVAERGAGRLRFKHDRHPWRIEVYEGPADDLARLSWEVADHTSMDAVTERLERGGIEVITGTAADCADRVCEALIRFDDPAGTPSEVVCGVPLGEPYESRRVPSGFIAGELGLGHAVVAARDKDESVRFYCDLLGFKISDHIRTDFHGHPVDLSFLHCNSRHHSIAMPCPPPKRIHHFLIEVGSVDDVGAALDRALRANCRIINVLGRHPNDQMLSFYAETPSGFQFEFGWGGRLVDDNDWTPEIYDRISDWGHTPPPFLKHRKKKAP